MTACGLTEAEAKAGLVIFHEMDKSSKLRLFFEILAASRGGSTCKSSDSVGAADNNTSSQQAATASDKDLSDKQEISSDHKENAMPNKSNNSNDASNRVPSSATPNKAAPRATTSCLDRDGALSLFQTILTAISCCVQAKEDDDTSLKPVVTQDEEIATKDSFDNPPKEMTKTGETSDSDDDSSSKPTATAPAQPASSTASPSHVGLSDPLKKEIESTALNAARRLVDFSLAKQQQQDSTTTCNTKTQEKEVSISLSLIHI